MSKGESNEYDILSSAERRSGAEERWVSFQPYLLSKGYRLRPRYSPEWVPSWKTSGLRPDYCEDSIDSMPLRVLDAIRIKDQNQVMIKMLIPKQGEGEDELAILKHFASPSLKDDTANHVVPCLDSFPISATEPGHFVIMPLLRQYDDLPFKRLSEVHDFLQQIFEGLLFMHRNSVAHCDISSANIMMDSRILYDEPFHPVEQTLSLDIQRMVYPKYSRLEKRVRYYFIDMGFASWFRDPSAPRLVTRKPARIMSPEQTERSPYDPFLVDIYQLGTVIKQDLIPQISVLDFLIPLAEAMTRSDPSTRPTLTKAQDSMNTAFLGLSGTRSLKSATFFATDCDAPAIDAMCSTFLVNLKRG
ncbi:kinase domain protein [Rhizoctonia solani]|uniref:Kinase domain protein n=1 Tax=Rhizoctonia solani TaxID=456999 RepID=A0A8H8NNT2_9AGAM|nr:kinase domain protein [Rhizoctonia solani]QRW15587.1 kinase domain protein [Rhizoctonia solani]